MHKALCRGLGHAAKAGPLTASRFTHGADRTRTAGGQLEHVDFAEDLGYRLKLPAPGRARPRASECDQTRSPATTSPLPALSCHRYLGGRVLVHLDLARHLCLLSR